MEAKIFNRGKETRASLDVTLPRQTTETNYYNVRDAAWEFLIKNNVVKFPIDIRALIQKNGWHLLSYSEAEKAGIWNEVKLNTMNQDGLTIAAEGRYMILYNDNQPEQRIRFTLAHEAGHIILHKEYAGEKLETEANMFASRILMPMCIIRECQISTAEELAKLCDVSLVAAGYRMERYNMVAKREMFYTNKLEKKYVGMLAPFIKQNKGKR